MEKNELATDRVPSGKSRRCACFSIIVGLCIAFPIPAFAGAKTQDPVICVLPAQRGMFLNPGVYKHEPPGLDHLASAIDAERSKGGPFLLVCNGDFVPPFSYHNMRKPKSAKWISDAERLEDPTVWRLLNALGIDVLTPGYTELRHPSRWLMQMQQACPSMRVVSINVADTTGKPLFPPYVVLKRGGIRFGVLGVSDGYQQPSEHIEMTSEKSMDTTVVPNGTVHGPRNSRSAELHASFFKSITSIGRDLRVQSPSGDGLSRTVSELRNQCDVVVALLNIPKEAADSLLNQVSGIDVAILRYSLPAETSQIGACKAISGTSGTDGFTKATLQRSRGRRGVDVVTVPASSSHGREDIADRIQSFMNLTYIERDLSEKWGRVSRSPEYEGYFGRLDSIADAPNRETDIFVIWPEGDKGQLAWKGDLAPPQRPLSADLTHPAAIRTLTQTRDGAVRSLPVGSDEESQAIQLLRLLAASQARGAERESLLAILEDRQGRKAPWSEWGRKLDSLHAFLEYQRAAIMAGDPPYWRRRSVVYASVAVDSNGAVTDVSVVENNDWPASADSVKQLQLARSAKEGTRILVGIAKDRREERFDAALDTLRTRWGKGNRRPDDELLPEDAPQWNGIRLPGPARKTLESKALASVISIWKKADPEFSWEDFICTPSDTVRMDPSSFSKKPGSKVLKELKTRNGGTLFVGWSTVEHPRFPNGTWGHLQVPTVWLAEREKHYLLRFQGALTPQINAPDVRQALEASAASSSPR